MQERTVYFGQKSKPLKEVPFLIRQLISSMNMVYIFFCLDFNFSLEMLLVIDVETYWLLF